MNATKNSWNEYTYKNLRFQKKGQSYAAYSFESFSSEPHCHMDFYEIILITNGSFKNIFGNVTTTVTENTLMVFTPGTIHQMYTEPLQGTHFVICIERHYFEQFAKQHFPGFQINNDAGFLSKTINKNRAQYIESLGKTLCRNTDFQPYLADEITFLTLSDFANYNPIADIDAYVTEIVTKMDNLLYINKSVQEICDSLHYSSYLLSKKFKEMTGYTLVEYKKKQKLKYACHLLATTDMKIVDIFAELHYSSLPYFLRAFKEAYGMTPTEYRQKKRQ